MNLDQAVTLTEDRLAAEGGTMGDLLGHFRNRISPVLIGDPEWELVLERAGKLPITMGALPFGFELPPPCTPAESGFRRLAGERNPIGGVRRGARSTGRGG